MHRAKGEARRIDGRSRMIRAPPDSDVQALRARDGPYLANSARLRYPRGRMRFETVVKMPSSWSGVYRHVAIHLFQDRVTVEQMDQLESVATAWRRRHPGKMVELVVIFPSNNQMTGEERSRMTKLMKRWEVDRTAAATVILADGLMGALHRSVLTGLVMLVPPSHPAKVFGSVRDAVTWLVPHVSALWNSAVVETELLVAVESFCAEFELREARPESIPPVTKSMFPSQKP